MPAHKSLRWSLTLACSEFGISPKALAQRVRTSGVEPGKDKKYSTADISKAIFGGANYERMLLTREQREFVAVKKNIALHKYIPLDIAERLWSNVIHDLNRKISYASIPDEVKQTLAEDLKATTADEYLSAILSSATDVDPEDAEESPSAD